MTPVRRNQFQREVAAQRPNRPNRPTLVNVVAQSVPTANSTLSRSGMGVASEKTCSWAPLAAIQAGGLEYIARGQV